MGRIITVSELSKTGDEVVLLDVRRREDFDGHVIPNAEWHDPEQVDEWAEGIPQDKEVVLYCVRGGSVSNKVLDSLLEKKIRARYIEGGIEAWKKSGGKLT